jgi:crotonobetainyl-CoA:carnitine CoA-transferase CaiB-like acyl-CoA transferase
VRALDLTRVIAGPVCGRTLAAQSADVLLVSAERGATR